MALSLTVSAKGNTNSDIEEALERAYLELVQGAISESYKDEDKEFFFEVSGEED
jgi:hypothetical protein